MLWPRDQSRFTKQIRGGHDLLALRKGRRRAAPGQAIAFWPARVAVRKGHSFIGYFLLSLVFFQLSLIMAYAVEDRSRVAYS